MKWKITISVQFPLILNAGRIHCLEVCSLQSFKFAIEMFVFVFILNFHDLTVRTTQLYSLHATNLLSSTVVCTIANDFLLYLPFFHPPTTFYNS